MEPIGTTAPRARPSTTIHDHHQMPTTPRRRSPVVGHLLAGSALLVVAAGALGAHDTWLIANAGSVPVNGIVTLDMSSGGKFPRNELAILPARVAQRALHVAGTSVPLAAPMAVPRALRFRTKVPQEGVALFSVSLHPKVLTLAPNLVKEYVDEIGAAPEFFTRWQSAPGQAWVERYSKHAKAFVRVGAASARDSGWARPTGQPYELVPQQNPTALVAGDSLSVLVLRCGRPLADVAVGTERGGSGHAGMARTNASGIATVHLARAGRWMVNSTYLAYADRVGPLCEAALPGDTVRVGYVSQFATMTFDVAATPRGR